MFRRVTLGCLLTVVGATVLGATAAAPATATTTVTHLGSLGTQALAATNPGGIALDADQNVYITNTGNDTVAKYLAGASAPVWTVGRRGDTRAQGSFENPRDIAVLNNRAYVAEPSGVQILDAATGAYIRQLQYGFRVPIGISTGNFADGTAAMLVSDGASGNVEIFDADDSHVLTIPPLDPASGTRDADTDSAGNIYVADYRNNRINKYSPTGQLLLQWGGGSDPCLDIPKPYGVEVDDQDRVFVAASNNNSIKVFDTSGGCIRSYGTAGDGLTKLSQLRRVAVGSGPAPKVYAADLWGLKVLIYNADGTPAAPLSRIGDGEYPDHGGLNEPMGVDINASGIHVADLNNHRIEIWAPDGSSVTGFGEKGRASGKAQFNWPHGAGLNPATGNIWVADTHSNNVKEFVAGGDSLALRQFNGVTGGKFEWPTDVLVAGDGTFYIADQLNGVVRSFAPDLSPGWVAHNIREATNLAWAPDGAILATSTGPDAVVRIDVQTGGVTPTGLTTGEEPQQVTEAWGIAVDASGKYWVSDVKRQEVRQFSPSGVPTGVSLGAPGHGPSQVSLPRGLAVSGNTLYVADSGNSRVQRYQLNQTEVLPTWSAGGRLADPAGISPFYPAGGDKLEGPNPTYIASSGSDDIARIDTNGSITELGVVGLNRPRDVEVVSDRLWILDTLDNQVVSTDLSGVVQKEFSPGLKSAFGIAADAAGPVVADTYNNRVIRLDPVTGTIVWTSTGCNGTFSRPRDVSITGNGQILVADTDKGRVAVLTGAGVCVRTFGSPGKNPGQFSGLRGVVSAPNGTIYTAEAGTKRVQHFTSSGQLVAASATNSSMGAPACVYLINSTTVGVCDTYENSVVTFVDAGSTITPSTTISGPKPALGGFNQPFGAVYDAAGNLYVSDMFNNRIQKFGPDGSPLAAWGAFGSAPGRFQFPRGLGLSHDGTELIVTDSENNRLQRYSLTGTRLGVVKPTGTVLGWPHQSVQAADGSYWLADTTKNRVVHLSATGALLGEFNGGGTINAPRGLAMDADGNLYVSNTGAKRVEKYSQSGTLLATLASGTSGASTVRQPWNLTISAAPGGEPLLYIADGFSNRVVVVGLDGTPKGTLGGNGVLAYPRSVAVNPTTGTVAVPSFDGHRVDFWQRTQ